MFRYFHKIGERISLSYEKRMPSWIPAAVVTAGLLFAYLPMLAKNITWANNGSDGGDLMAAALTLGVAHPSGYPTTLLLLHATQLIPISTPYWRGSLLSALAASLAGGLLCYWLQGELSSPSTIGKWATAFASACAAFTWGNSPLIWSQAVIVEVYALNALFVSLFFVWAQRLTRPKSRMDALWLPLLALLLGAGLGNHLTLVLLAPAAMLTVFFARQSGRSWSALCAGTLPALAGMGIYVYLPLAARAYPPINWGNPQTWDSFLWVVSGQLYQGMLLHPPSALLIGRITASGSLFLAQFGIPGTLLGILGAISAWRTRRFSFWLIAWGVFAYTLFSIYYQSTDAEIYLIPAYWAYAAWIAFGLTILWGWRWRQQPIGAVVSLFFLLYLLIRLPVTAVQVDPNNDPRAAQFQSALLTQSPPNALILTTTDQDSFPLDYAHFGLHQRPDLRLFTLPLAEFDWYRNTLRHTYPDLRYPDKADLDGEQWINLLIQYNPSRPICRTELKSDNQGVTFQCH